MIAVGDADFAPAGDYLPDWDYATNLRVQRTISLDLESVARDLEIPADELSLSVGLRVGTGQGRLPRAVLHRSFHHLGSQSSVTVEAELAGLRLSAVLDLALELVLATTPTARSDLSPDQTTDRVWHDGHRVRLEGDEPRLPIEIADLSAILGNSSDASAPWFLEWSPRDWSRDLHGSLRLYLNSANPEFVRRVQDEDEETLRVLLADVMGQICERFVSDDDAEDFADSCEPGSLARQAVSWLQLAWPGRDIAFARSLLARRPGRFRAAFLGIAEQGSPIA